MQTIDLDCAPGEPRPGDLIEQVVEGTPAATLLAEPVAKLFGNWTWRFDIPRSVWEAEVQPIIKARITALYEAGTIRYGSW